MKVLAATAALVVLIVGLLHLEVVEDAAMALLNSEFVERWWG